MRKGFSLFVLALVVTAAAVVAQPVPTASGPATGYPFYFEPTSGQCLPPINFIGGAPPAGSGWIGVAECPPPAAGGGSIWWAAVKDWLDGTTVYKPNPGTLARILGMLAGFLAFVQALKKLAEKGSKWAWLLKLVPQVGAVLAFLSGGIGPIIINACVTGGTMLTVALGDGTLTGGEVASILAAVVGTDVLYRVVFDWLKLLPRNVK